MVYWDECLFFISIGLFFTLLFPFISRQAVDCNEMKNLGLDGLERRGMISIFFSTAFRWYWLHVFLDLFWQIFVTK